MTSGFPEPFTSSLHSSGGITLYAGDDESIPWVGVKFPLFEREPSNGSTSGRSDAVEAKYMHTGLKNIFLSYPDEAFYANNIDKNMTII